MTGKLIDYDFFVLEHVLFRYVRFLKIFWNAIDHKNFFRSGTFRISADFCSGHFSNAGVGTLNECFQRYRVLTNSPRHQNY